MASNTRHDRDCAERARAAPGRLLLHRAARLPGLRGDGDFSATFSCSVRGRERAAGDSGGAGCVSGNAGKDWADSDLLTFVKELRKNTKPIVIAANKADLCKDLEIIKKISDVVTSYS